MKKLLSQGSFGKVYLIEENGEKFIRKVFSSVYRGYNDAVKETKILLELRNHDCGRYFVCIRGEYTDNNLVLYDDDLRCYFDLEYVENSHDLYKYILDKNLDITSKISLIYAILKAFDSLHKICEHNDVKASNILCTVNEHNQFGVKIIDYGMSCLKDDEKCEEEMKKTAFAPYFAPEYYTLNQRLVYSKADIWQIGLTIYDILFKSFVPWENLSPDYLLQLTDEEIYIILQKRFQFTIYDKETFTESQLELIEKEVKKLLISCLKTNPEDRPTCKELLETFTNTEEIQMCIDYGVDSLIADIKK